MYAITCFAMSGEDTTQPSAWSAGLAIALSAVYLWSVVRVLLFLGDRPSLNSSARGSTLMALAIPGVLYLATLVQWVVYRHRTGSVLPVVGAVLIGCLVSFVLGA